MGKPPHRVGPPESSDFQISFVSIHQLLSSPLLLRLLCPRFNEVHGRLSFLLLFLSLLLAKSLSLKAFFQMYSTARLRKTMASLMITTQCVGQIFEVIIPWLSEKYKLGKRVLQEKARTEKASQGSEQNKSASGLQPAFSMLSYEQQGQLSPAGPMFDEYVEMTIQFG